MRVEEMRKALYSQLYVLKAQLETIVYMIEEIEKDVEETIPSCSHAKQFRKNYTTMGGAEHWVCDLCGFEFKGDK